MAEPIVSGLSLDREGSWPDNRRPGYRVWRTSARAHSALDAAYVKRPKNTLKHHAAESCDILPIFILADAGRPYDVIE
jgi:hypothetical protein